MGSGKITADTGVTAWSPIIMSSVLRHCQGEGRLVADRGEGKSVVGCKRGPFARRFG